jgi:hypothetical protein
MRTWLSAEEGGYSTLDCEIRESARLYTGKVLEGLTLTWLALRLDAARERG